MKSRGFTFLELLMALAIFAAIAATVQVTLQTGILTFNRGRGAGDLQRQLHAGLDLVSRELRSIQPFYFADAPFEGGPDRLSYTALIRISPAGETARYVVGTASFELGTVSGEEDAPRALTWGLSPFDGRIPPGGDRRVILEGADTLAFLYGGHPEEEGEEAPEDPAAPALSGRDPLELEWTDAWERDTLPAAIRVHLGAAGADGIRYTLSRTVYLPAGGRPFADEALGLAGPAGGLEEPGLPPPGNAADEGGSS